MQLTLAQKREIYAAIFDTPLMIASDALAAMNSCLQEVFAGVDNVNPKSKLQSSMDGPASTIMVGSVAVVPLTGPLASKPSFYLDWVGGTSTDNFLRDVRSAMNNPDVKAIVFYVDSPGGSAIGNEEVSNAIRGMRGTKPMCAFVQGYCASAAYYIASAADQIYATPSSIEGSIGTILVHTDVSKMRQSFGVTDSVITNTASPSKGAGNPYEPLSADAKAQLKSRVDAFGEQFINAVAANRNTSRANVVKQYGQGDAYLSEEALKRGMIDKIVPDLSSAIAEISSVTSSSKKVQAGGTDLSAPQDTFQTKEFPIVNAKIKSALFARSLVVAADASDEICNATIAAYFAGSNRDVPKDDGAILSALMTSPAAAAPLVAAIAATAPIQLPATLPATTLPGPKSISGKEVLEFSKNLSAAADLLNRSGGAIDQKQIDASLEEIVNGAKTHTDVVAGWTNAVAKKEKGVSKPDIVGEGSQRFEEDAANALFYKFARTKPKLCAKHAPEKPNAEALRISAAPLAWIAQQSLKMAGERVPEFGMNLEQVAEQALQMGANGGQRYNVQSVFGEVSSAQPINRPGDFPNIMSNLAGKLIDWGIKVAPVMYSQWTGELGEDMIDFNPKSIVARSEPNEFEEILDAEDTKELILSEELLSMIQARRWSGMIGLTPIMVANNQLGAFSESNINMGMTHERTLNRLCLGIITGNAALLDGNAFFDDTNHGNDLTSGNGSQPGETAADAMDIKFSKQKGVGGVGYSSARFKVALITRNYRSQARRAWSPFDEIPEAKLSTTDAGISTYRGEIQPVVEDALQDYSTSLWYGFADPELYPAVVRAYFQGWGRGGQRQRWYDPKNKTTWIELEGRFAAAAKNYRYAVRNFGS